MSMDLYSFLAQPVEPSPSPAPRDVPSAAPTPPHASTSTSTSAPAGGGKLPTSGPDATGLVLVGLAVCAVGAALVAMSARWRARRAARG